MSHDEVTRIGYALSHPLRIEILKSLMREEASAKTLSRSLETPVANVSYHLCRILYETCGLVVLTARHQRRGATEKVFALRPGSSTGVVATVIAEAEEGAGGSNGRRSGWQSVAVDGRGKREIEDGVEELGKIVDGAERRSARSGSGELHYLIVSRAIFGSTQT